MKVTTAIVPASGTPMTSATPPIRTALNSATIVTPRKYLRRAWTVSPVTMSPTDVGTPMLRLIHCRMSGPSLRTKNVVKTANVTSITTDESLLDARHDPADERPADLRDGLLQLLPETAVLDADAA